MNKKYIFLLIWKFFFLIKFDMEVNDGEPIRRSICYSNSPTLMINIVVKHFSFNQLLRDLNLKLLNQTVR